MNNRRVRLQTTSPMLLHHQIVVKAKAPWRWRWFCVWLQIDISLNNEQNCPTSDEVRHEDPIEQWTRALDREDDNNIVFWTACTESRPVTAFFSSTQLMAHQRFVWSCIQRRRCSQLHPNLQGFACPSSDVNPFRRHSSTSELNHPSTSINLFSTSLHPSVGPCLRICLSVCESVCLSTCVCLAAPICPGCLFASFVELPVGCLFVCSSTSVLMSVRLSVSVCFQVLFCRWVCFDLSKIDLASVSLTTYVSPSFHR